MDDLVTIFSGLNLLGLGSLGFYIYQVIKGLRQRITALSQLSEEQKKTLEIVRERATELDVLSKAYKDALSDFDEMGLKIKERKDQLIGELEDEIRKKDEKLMLFQKHRNVGNIVEDISIDADSQNRLQIKPHISFFQFILEQVIEQLPDQSDECESIIKIKDDLYHLRNLKTSNEISKSSAMWKMHNLVKSLNQPYNNYQRNFRNRSTALEITLILTKQYNEVAERIGLPKINTVGLIIR